MKSCTNGVLPSPLVERGARGEADFDVALARTEGVGRSESDPDSVSRPRRSRRAGNTGSRSESPAEARRWAPHRGAQRNAQKLTLILNLYFYLYSGSAIQKNFQANSLLNPLMIK